MSVKKFLTYFIVFLWFVVFQTSQTTVAQAPIDDLIITRIDASDFPQLDVRFRALDQQGQPVVGLTTSGLEIRENDEAMTPESIETIQEGLWIHFVIDAGAGLTEDRWENVREGILNFAKTTPWMMENLDNVAVTVVEGGNRRLLVDFTSDPDVLENVLESANLSGNREFSNPLPVVGTLLDELDLITEAQGQAKFIFFFTPRLERGGSSEARRLLDKSKVLDIPVFTTLVREDGPTTGNAEPTEENPFPVTDQPIIDLGNESGGAFTWYQDVNSMNAAYRRATDQRLQYDLSFRSTLGIGGTRQVELTADIGGTGSVVDAASYDIEVNPPRLLIEEPRAGETIVREALEYTEDRGSVEPTTQTVVATVVFPDEHVRRLRRATLLVDNAVAAMVQTPNAGNIELSWNLRDIQELGVNDFSLQVEVEDELGLVATSPPVLTKVDLIIPSESAFVTQQTETVQVEVTRLVESPSTSGPIPSFVPTPIPCVSSGALCNNIERPIRTNPLASIMTMVALTALVFAGVVWINRDKPSVQAMRNTVVGVVDRLTKKYRGPAEAKAYLVVLEGDRSEGKSLEIFGDTPIGRSRQNAELLFHQEDETSPISRLHCTIIDEDDHFLLRDEDSANGTYLNGVRLQALVTEEIHDGDEIELARVERGGVRLLFQRAKQEVAAEFSDDLTVTSRSTDLDDASMMENGSHHDGGDRF